MTPFDAVREEVRILSAEVDHSNDQLSDVFGSAPSSPAFEKERYFEAQGGYKEHSDIPRLREKHEKEGYRDGVTKGKAETVQKGFDEGYSLGAVMGLRIGKVLGLLEGICATVWSASSETSQETVGVDWTGESERLRGIVETAREELKTRNVFGSEWWNEDGTWKFEVAGEGERKEVVFGDVADSHPLVVKWERVVEEEVGRWGLDLGVLDGEREDDGDPIVQKGRESTAKQGQVGLEKNKELVW